MKSLTSKRIVLAVSGSIAAYKAPDIVRRLQDLGAEVRVILTTGGSKFITEMSLQAISKNKVHDNLWDKDAELSMGHIELAKWADAILIAPASANTIANIASGKANDLLTSVILASDCPIILAPAMNQKMYSSIALKDNLSVLHNRNMNVISPDYGDQACGDVGEGRLPEPVNIATKVSELFKNTRLTGKKVLITIGATIEEIDPVRFLSNRSSGKMGMALANTCIEYGADVTIVYGNISTQLNDRCNNISVTSAEQMYKAVMKNIDHQDVFISCAAVCDYKIKDVSKDKIKRSGSNMFLELVPNKDILFDVCKLNSKPVTIGFSAETQNLTKNAKNKLINKGCDAIILNDVSRADIGFNSDDNEVVFLTSNQSIKIEKNSKQKVGKKIIEILCNKLL
ncbi:MAG TPA: bifunctional phosphopantothenoylcysteine decarboxylase/phosphopantothenate--cysteine ligase CoaBC [Candidatus Thioglobus sp.]|jgi:phosphopantothenoylcysteine decarboxylase/phosphopantothenate--cysteine ligase|nr:bifunctional phosphopantothenoylcysteine decarboxylase/phosphopantothenate--cysteine ligase CoaBC [Candidatus Thioglobus sp.]HIL43048.1 bifunctional phosphopantothenoylcysteine decarboxylase/phosphopantothenate--cysteine ligase CoaBC [Gammaproteobacteria bacterium]